MQNIILSLLINGLMAALLLATMIYCWKLNARIKVLQDSKSELASIIKEFDESTRRATQSIAEIHVATNRISENIQHKIDKANFLADDLQYMIEKGQRLSGKGEISSARLSPSAAPTAAPAAEAKPAARATTPAPGAAFILPDAPAAQAPRTAESLTTGAAAATRPLRMRSRAEQEIMSALGTKNTTGE